MVYPPDYDFMLKPTRAGSRAVHVYNDGLTGLLYDQSNEAAIRDASPSALFGAGPDLFDDEPTLAELARGRLLLFGMHGDGTIDMEVIVGEPLTEAELSRGEWMIDGPAHIDLPSGRLAIHSYNSLPIGDVEPDPMEVGGFVDVAPGRYHVRLYRKEWPEVPEEVEASLPYEARRAMEEIQMTEVLVLTPFAPDEPVPQIHNVLFRDCIDFGLENAPA